MKQSLILMIACILFATVTLHAAKADKVIVRVNVYDEVYLSQADQDAEIKRLAEDGVKTVRTGLGWNTAYFITQAFKHGIGTVAIVYPDADSKAKRKGAGAGVPFSQVDPQVFAHWFKINLDRMEAAGVRLTAIELGNEFNMSGGNGDISKPGSGVVLGLSRLKDPDDLEGRPIAAGYRVYVQVAAALKDLRDHSKLNKTTPIIVGGLVDWGLVGQKTWNHELGVGLPDTIQFLRENGLDKLVDGYGVHIYPSGDPHLPMSTRVSELEHLFSECKPDTKPCWLTEWGLPNSNQVCPLDDRRTPGFQAVRTALKKFVEKGRLAAVVYYSWTGPPDPKAEPLSIFRCGALTDAGKLALSPL